MSAFLWDHYNYFSVSYQENHGAQQQKSSLKVPFSTIGELKKNGEWILKIVSATGQERPVPFCFFKQTLHFAFEDYIRQIFFLLLSSQKNFLYAS